MGEWVGRWVGGSSAEVFVIVKGCAAVDRFSGSAMQKCEWSLTRVGFVGSISRGISSPLPPRCGSWLSRGIRMKVHQTIGGADQQEMFSKYLFLF